MNAEVKIYILTQPFLNSKQFIILAPSIGVAAIGANHLTFSFLQINQLQYNFVLAISIEFYFQF